MTPAVANILLRAPFNPYRRPDLVAAYDASRGVVADSANRVSQWNDLSGKARHLLQGTGANQPLYLPYSGNKYAFLPGVSGNYISTPDSAALDVIGDVEIIWRGHATDLGLNKYLVSKYNTATDQRSYALATDGVTANRLVFRASADGLVGTAQQYTATADNPFTSTDLVWIKAWRKVNDGGSSRVRFFYSLQNVGLPAQVTWTQIGNEVVTSPQTIFAGTAPVEIGSLVNGTSGLMGQQCYYAEIRNGIDGPVVAKFDAREAGNNASSFVSSIGETWTIHKTGARPAQLVGSARMLFDGTNYFQKAAAFTLGQPTTVYLVAHPITYTSGDYFCDGDGNDTLVIEQLGTTPAIDLYAGSTGPASSAATLASWHVISGIFNGARSRLQVDNGAIVTGDVGTGQAGGFTLAARADGSGRSNIMVDTVLIFNSAHDDRTRARVYDYLRRHTALNLSP